MRILVASASLVSGVAVALNWSVPLVAVGFFPGDLSRTGRAVQA